ncbi:polysaccharide deacetylase family protein [Salipaludibacillus sp. LMS25]|jgi:peptidoglycan/xylan/chitin deacetylase (PgdA/CDA1 family)|uniref:polysaccharide deacetylase family protein n=1 Tax=Salipaludibacillus sp. LMS25 TaxID=2924031 RepID=UPI0020D0AE21|nr:polysaccharide deacetylase family protein [Salipaludibacillus sp. LMS25]UTR15724.1 polysaccharide deacetylase family protein [Salipaludibacillus sp. LMS25]
MSKLRIISVVCLLLLASGAYMLLYEQNIPSSDTYDVEKAIITKSTVKKPSVDLQAHTNEVLEKWQGQHIEPTEWGEHISGVKNRIDTEEKIIALTFDACGGAWGEKYDEVLINFLKEEDIPATLFINARWIAANKEAFMMLAEEPLFSIQNHGTQHLPLSVSGKTAWGIEGTASVEEIIHEIMDNQSLIYELTGHSPAFFRSGTAHYDDLAVQITQELGLTIVNYDVLGDAGATYSATEVEEALLTVGPGSIPLLHMNQPTSGTAEGVMAAIPQLKERGFTFVHLADQPLID